VNLKSGIYARFGSENKDVVTEASAEEFKNWLAIKGLNISFMSNETLDGFFLKKRDPFRQLEIRMAFIMDAQAKGITIYKVKEDWEAFIKAYQEEVQKFYG
jgi:PHP family Zn ribbon phosphoesterase